uniref:Uncharacterized protein n=1 Tax=Anguilla anguilla TaxID=7936 RepID=A0A0E9SJX2_ANGAN
MYSCRILLSVVWG